MFFHVGHVLVGNVQSTAAPLRKAPGKAGIAEGKGGKGKPPGRAEVERRWLQSIQAKAANQWAKAEAARLAEPPNPPSDSAKRKAVVLLERPRSESPVRVAADLRPSRERHFAVCVSCRQPMSRVQLMLAEGGHLVQGVTEQQPTILIACFGREGCTLAELSPWMVEHVEFLGEAHQRQPPKEEAPWPSALAGNGTAESDKAPETSANTDRDASVNEKLAAEREIFVKMICHSIQASHYTLGMLSGRQREQTEHMVKPSTESRPARSGRGVDTHAMGLPWATDFHALQPITQNVIVWLKPWISWMSLVWITFLVSPYRFPL